MANWQKSSTREPSRTKAELRQMLTEAVRNTLGPKQQPERAAKAGKVTVGADRVG